MQTEAHALILYHLNYDNAAYAAVTDGIVAMLGASDEDIRNTPDYIALSNLLTNAALEICGYPPYQGQGWQLAISLRKLTETGQLSAEVAEQLFGQVEAYLAHFAEARRSFDDHLHSKPQAQAAFELQGLGQLLAEAIHHYLPKLIHQIGLFNL